MSNQKGVAPVFILIGFLVIALIAGGLYYLENKNNHSIQYTNSVPSNTPSYQIKSQVPKPSPSPINYPNANINSIKNKLVLRYNSSILVSDTNGSNIMKLIDGQNKPGFAGWSDEGKVIYYTELVNSKFTVYKKDLTSGVVTQLFTFMGKDQYGKNEEFYYGNVAVTHDGKHAIYSHDNGDISLYDIVNKTDKKLLNQKVCLSQNNQQELFNFVKPVFAGGQDCYGYYFPYWSPNDQRVVLRKIFYEGATQVVINPFENPVQEKGLKSGGSPPRWSPDSTMIAIAGSGYGQGSLYLITNIDNPVNKDVLQEHHDFKYSGATSVEWSNDGKLAFTYSIYEGSDNKSGVALYNINDNSIKPLIISPSNGEYNVETWLSDNKTVLIIDEDEKNNIWSLDVNTLSKQNLGISVDDVIGIVR